MTKISLELDAGLNKRLKQFALDNYSNAHGKQQIIIRDALIDYLDAHERASKPRQVIEPERNQVVYGMPHDGESNKKQPATPVAEDVEFVCVPTEPAAAPKTKTKAKKPHRGKAKEGKLTDADDARIRELLASGIDNSKEIARQIGHDGQYQTVLRHINKIGMEGME
jgi:hypothetical protein